MFFFCDIMNISTNKWLTSRWSMSLSELQETAQGVTIGFFFGLSLELLPINYAKKIQRHINPAYKKRAEWFQTCEICLAKVSMLKKSSFWQSERPENASPWVTNIFLLAVDIRVKNLPYRFLRRKKNCPDGSEHLSWLWKTNFELSLITPETS